MSFNVPLEFCFNNLVKGLHGRKGSRSISKRIKRNVHPKGFGVTIYTALLVL